MVLFDKELWPMWTMHSAHKIRSQFLANGQIQFEAPLSVTMPYFNSFWVDKLR
jgi:hypothetical protein